MKDTDGDGLLDIWESSTTTLSDPNGQPLPNLAAMGADPDQKDLFIEIGYMKTRRPDDLRRRGQAGALASAHAARP